MDRPLTDPPGAPPGVAVRAATLADVATIVDVQLAGWRVGYRDIVPATFLASLHRHRDEDRWRRRLADPAAATLVAGRGGRVEGFAVHGPSRDPDRRGGAPRPAWELYALYVDPAAWRAGIGRRLLTRVIADSAGLDGRPLLLWVLEQNARARAFYERLGFAADGTRRRLDLGGPVPEVRYVYRA